MRQKIDRYLGNFLVGLMAIMTIDVLWGVFTGMLWVSRPVGLKNWPGSF